MWQCCSALDTVYDSAAVRVWRCVAVVCTVDSVRLVHAAVCGSVIGSVWQCARHCAAVRQCSSVRQCNSVRRSMRHSLCGSVAACGKAAVCGSVRPCGSVRQGQCVTVRAAVCSSVLGSVWQCARQCATER